VSAAVTAGIEAREHTATAVLRTLVLADLVDSTALVERLGDQRAAELIRRHDRFARALVVAHGGREIDKTDGFMLMFERPIQAVAFALAYQRDLAALARRENAPLAARIGVHVGDVVVWENSAGDVQRGAKQTEVEGLVKPVAARLMQLALPGQILLSGVAYDIAHRAQGELGESLATVRWRAHGRYKFKGVPEPVPVFEVGEEGIAPLKPPPWTSKAHRETPIWKRPIAIGLEALALVALIGIPLFYLTRPAPAIAFANRDFVVVGDLKNLTGDASFDDSLKTAFRIGLEQSRYVNVMPDLQVRGALKRMERDGSTGVDRTVGSEVALREGARAVVLPTVAEIGGRVRLTAEIVDPTTQTSVYSDSVDGAGEESVLPSMDALLRKMRERLGESIGSIGETSAPLADVTTKNLDALKAYTSGLQSVADGKAGESVALFNRATELDPDFSLAWLGLANVYYTTGQKAKAREVVSKATAHLDRLSGRERLVAEGYASFFADPAAMREKWSLLAKLYPDAMTGQNNLGLIYYWLDNALPEAAEQFEIVGASRHPRRGYSWLLLGDVDVALNRFDAAKKAYETARQVGSPQLNLDPLNLALATRDFTAGDAELAQEATRKFPYFEAEKALRTASLDVAQGRFDAARTAADSAADIATQAKLAATPERAKLASIAIALAAATKGAGDALDRYIDGEIARLWASKETYDFSSYTHLSLAAMLALRNDRAASAKRALTALAPYVENSGYFGQQEPYRVAICESGIANDAGAAAKCLEALVSDRAYYQTQVALLRAYSAAKDDDSALRTAEWLAAHRGRAAAEYLGEFAAQVPNLIAADEAAITAAELQAKSGRADDARKTLAALKAAWAKAEGEPALARRMRELDATLGSAEKKNR
jgi:putative peptide modification system cyclase